MNNQKTLIVGLLATTIGGGLLQAESLTLTFGFQLGAAVSYGGAGSFTGSIPVASITSSGPGAPNSSCIGCTFNFSTGALVAPGFTTTSDVSGTHYSYAFGSSGSSFGLTGTSVNNPSPTPAGASPNPPAVGGVSLSSTDLGDGTIGAFTGKGDLDSVSIANPTPPPAFFTVNETILTFLAPVSTLSSANPNLQSILAAFGLTGTSPLSGSLLLIIGVPSADSGAFSGQILGGGLTLDVANVIPEPSSVLLIGLGLLCVAFIGRKRLLSDHL